MYRDGFVRMSLPDYDPKSTDATVHLTTTAFKTEKLKADPEISAEERIELIEGGTWLFEESEAFAMKEFKVGKDWFNSKVRKPIKTITFQLVRMIEEDLLKHPGVYELIGMDFIMDTDHNVWFLEANLGPGMKTGMKKLDNVYYKNLEDVTNIEFAIQFGGDLDTVMSSTDFEWIYDGRKEDFSKYHGLITPDCV